MRNARGAWAAAAAAALTMLGTTTAAPAHADDCANAAFRTGASAGLPDCRALERVSPADKHGNNVSEIGQVLAAPVGGRALFQASGAFGQADGVPYFGAYAGFRGADDWTTQASDPPIDGGNLINGVTLAYADDGSRSVVISRAALTVGATPGGSNLYVRDLTQPSAYTLVATRDTGDLYRAYTSSGSPVVDGTTDFSTLLLATTISLDPGTPGTPSDPQSTFLYRWTAATGLRRVDAYPGAPLTTPDARTAVSSDGARVTATRLRDNVGNVYQYVDGDARLVSRSRTASLSSGANPIASADGRHVFFDGPQPLTSRSRPDSGSIYRWDADTDALTDLLVGLAGYAPQGSSTSPSLMGASDDGQLLWIQTVYQLTADTPADTTSIYLIDLRANRLRRVASGPPGIYAGVRFSPNRRAAAIQSCATLTVGGSDTSTCADGALNQVYTYVADAPQPALACASCGGTPTGNVGFGAAGTILQTPFTPIADDGRTFFDTPTRLTTADANAVRDVYEYTPGVGVQLLSSGTGSSPAKLADTGANGQDVLFVTADPLVPADTDPQVDLYDARVGGGLAGQQVRPDSVVACRGEACRPAPTPPLADPVVGTSTLVGASPPKVPSFRVAKPSAKALRSAARRGRLAVSATVGAPGTLAASLRGRLSGRRVRTAALDNAKAKRAGRVALTLRLSRRARRALRREGRLKLSLTVGYSERTTRYRTTITLRTGRSDRKGGRR